MFGLRNLGVKVFGKVFGYCENLRESEIVSETEGQMFGLRNLEVILFI